MGRYIPTRDRYHRLVLDMFDSTTKSDIVSDGPMPHVHGREDKTRNRLLASPKMLWRVGNDATKLVLLKERQDDRFQSGDVEALPVDDNSVDVVITNGVFNLRLSKAEVLGEVFREQAARAQSAELV